MVKKPRPLTEIIALYKSGTLDRDGLVDYLANEFPWKDIERPDDPLEAEWTAEERYASDMPGTMLEVDLAVDRGDIPNDAVIEATRIVIDRIKRNNAAYKKELAPHWIGEGIDSP